MRVLLWTTIVVLIVLIFAGDKVRSYFEGGSRELAEASDAGQGRTSARESVKPPAAKPDPDRRSASGAYAPSPADAPELYDSPTRRFGF